jgi:hypothetical protein
MLGGRNGNTLFIVAAHWPGAEHFLDHTAWDGMVISTAAPTAAAGWPGPHQRY